MLRALTGSEDGTPERTGSVSRGGSPDKEPQTSAADEHSGAETVSASDGSLWSGPHGKQREDSLSQRASPQKQPKVKAKQKLKTKKKKKDYSKAKGRLPRV